MIWLAEQFASGRIIDIILALVVIEVVFVAVLNRFIGRGPRLPAIAYTLLSGIFLLIAVRFALTDTVWPMIALALLAALVAHIADLSRRA